MKKQIVILGGGPAGIITANTAKKTYPDKQVTVIRKEKAGLVPCGIPYIFGTLNSVDANVMGIAPSEKLGVEYMQAEVLKIDFVNKSLTLENSENVEYEKLIIATGSNPILLRGKGFDLDGVFTISKSKPYMEKVFAAAQNASKVLVIGGGFIGIETGDELRKMGKEVTLVEALPELLSVAFDKEFGEQAEEKLSSNGMKVIKGIMVEEIIGEDKVKAVKLSDGTVVESDMVILSIGYIPNTSMFKDSEINLGDTGGIWVDEYMRTSVKDVFAAGDCAEHKDFFTRKSSKLMLASTAVFDARIAGSNLYSLNVVRENHGNLGVFSTSIQDLTLAAAGMTEKTAKEEGFEIIIGEAAGIDRHPGTLPDKTKTKIKLLFSKESGLLLGAQVSGGKSVGEMVNTLGLAIQNRVTANDLFTMQIGTHPLLTSAPTTYPIVVAAENAILKLRKLSR